MNHLYTLPMLRADFDRSMSHSRRRRYEKRCRAQGYEPISRNHIDISHLLIAVGASALLLSANITT